MADTAAEVRQCVSMLRDLRFRVVPVDGWETRGKGAMTTRGRVEHHTAGPRVTSGTPSLRTVTFGRAGLRNSLSRWYTSPTGVIYLVALGVSWHAGSGVKGTNTTLSGTEGEHSGQASQPWPARQLEAMAAISRVEAVVFGFPLDAVWEHKEHAPARKPDRINIDGDTWRARLASAVDPSTGEAMFVRHGDEGEAVQYVQLLLADVDHPPVGGADGDFGDKTAQAIAAYWSDRHDSDYHGREVTSHVLRALHRDALGAGQTAPAASSALSSDDQAYLAEFVAAGRKRDAGPQSPWHPLDWLRTQRDFFGRYFR